MNCVLNFYSSGERLSWSSVLIFLPTFFGGLVSEFYPLGLIVFQPAVPWHLGGCGAPSMYCDSFPTLLFFAVLVVASAAQPVS